MKSLLPQAQVRKIVRKITHFKKELDLYTLLILILSLLFILGLIFIWGYSSGYQDGNLKPASFSPTLQSQKTITSNFEITPYPPDESSWIKFTGLMHYHQYVIAIPPQFIEESGNNGNYTFADTTDNEVLRIRVPATYTHITKPRYTIAGLSTSYSQHIQDSIDTETALMDFGNEDLQLTFSAPSSIYYFFFRNIVNTLTYETYEPSYPSVMTSLTTSLFQIIYPSAYVPDTLYEKTQNCNGTPESIVNLMQRQYIIHIDIGSCPDWKTHSVVKMNEDILNKQTYLRIFFTDNMTCYINTRTPALKNALLTSVKLAPRDTVLQDTTAQLCLQGNILHANLTVQRAILADLHTVLASIQMNQ